MTQKTIASLVAQLKMESTQWRQEIGKAKKDLGDLGEKSRLLSADFDAANKNIGRSLSSMRNMAVTALGAIGVSLSVGKIYEYAEAWTSLNNRLKLVSTGAADLASKQADVLRIANEARAPIQATADLYSKITQAGQILGLTQERIANVTETVSKAMVVSGGSAASTEAAILQLNQALASGVLRGEEFNSISEQAPAVLKAIADGLNVNIGQLRQYAQDGKLSSQVVIAALEEQSNAIDKQFSKMAPTVSQGLTVLQNGLMTFVGRMDEATGFSSSLAEVLTDLGKQIGAVGDNSKSAATNAGDFTEALRFSAFTAVYTSKEVAQLADNIKYLWDLAGGVDLGFGGLEKTKQNFEKINAAYEADYQKRETDFQNFVNRLQGLQTAANTKELADTQTHETNKNTIKTNAELLLQQQIAKLQDEKEAEKAEKQAIRDAEDEAKALTKAESFFNRMIWQYDEELRIALEKRDADFARMDEWHLEDLARLDKEYSEELALLQDYERRHLNEKARTADVKARIDANYVKQKALLEQQEALRTMRYDKMNAQNRLQMHDRMGRALIAIGGSFAGKLFKINQGLALAQAVVALPASVMESFKNGGGYPWGLIPAGLMLAEGLAQIASIKNASFDSGGGGGGAIGSIGGGGPTSTYGPTPGAPLDNVQQFMDADAKPNQNKLEVSVTVNGLSDDGIYTGSQFSKFIDEVTFKIQERNLAL